MELVIAVALATVWSSLFFVLGAWWATRDGRLLDLATTAAIQQSINAPAVALFPLDRSIQLGTQQRAIPKAMSAP